MSVKITKATLENRWFSFNSMTFLPSKDTPIKSEWAIFTHGYTASKSDCITWASRLADIGVPSIIFDQPGHYLGGFHEVDDFDEFVGNAHFCFETAFDHLKNQVQLESTAPEPNSVILAGHSLGALMAIKALELGAFDAYNKVGVGIGIGISQHKSTHLFETSFYEKTINIRRQLVSPALDSKQMFSWIADEKKSLSVSHQRIHLITGADDVVVGQGGVEAFHSVLKKHGNDVSIDQPKRLPHHEPSNAAPFLFHFLKTEFSWT